MDDIVPLLRSHVSFHATNFNYTSIQFLLGASSKHFCFGAEDMMNHELRSKPAVEDRAVHPPREHM